MRSDYSLKQLYSFSTCMRRYREEYLLLSSNHYISVSYLMFMDRVRHFDRDGVSGHCIDFHVISEI